MHIKPYLDGSILNARWRGSSLSQFDGKRWFNPPTRDDWQPVDRGVLLLKSAARRHGHSVAYQVELNDIASDVLFFAGTPESITINVPLLRFSRGGTVRPPARTFTTGLRYGVRSYLEEDLAPTVEPRESTPAAPVDYLQLPALDDRIPALAHEMAAGATGDFARAKAIEKGLQTRYGYTLQLLDEPVSDPLAYFLFVRRKGHCEYFASSMAVMLRTLGIPSRVATGFLSGVYNPMTGWQVIRSSDAHSWVEAYIPGQGWTIFDPTPSDPSAVTSGLMSRFAPVDGYGGPVLAGLGDGIQPGTASRARIANERIKSQSSVAALRQFRGLVPDFGGRLAARPLSWIRRHRRGDCGTNCRGVDFVWRLDPEMVAQASGSEASDARARAILRRDAALSKNAHAAFQTRNPQAVARNASGVRRRIARAWALRSGARTDALL